MRPGDQQIEIKLDLAEVQEVLNVEQDKREANLDPRGRAFTTVLTAEQIAQLPDDPEEFEQAIRDMAGPGATFRVNGFRGGKLPPKSQIREIRFRMNPYAAENHDASMIGVDILTKPGLNNWHGSLNAGFRDEALNARNAFAPFRAPEQNRRFGFELSGPLWRKHTSVSCDSPEPSSTVLVGGPASVLDPVKSGSSLRGWTSWWERAARVVSSDDVLNADFRHPGDMRFIALALVALVTLSACSSNDGSASTAPGSTTSTNSTRKTLPV